MKRKKIAAVVGACALAMALSVSGAALAAPLTSGAPAAAGVSSGSDMTAASSRAAADAMKRQTDDMRAKMDQAAQKWAMLTAAQKEQIYSLMQQQADVQGKILDTYVSLGIIDQAAAAQMKQQMSARLAALRQDGKMPLPGRMGGGGSRGKAGAPDSASSQ